MGNKGQMSQRCQWLGTQVATRAGPGPSHVRVWTSFNGLTSPCATVIEDVWIARCGDAVRCLMGGDGLGNDWEMLGRRLGKAWRGLGPGGIYWKTGRDIRFRKPEEAQMARHLAPRRQFCQKRTSRTLANAAMGVAMGVAMRRGALAGLQSEWTGCKRSNTMTMAAGWHWNGGPVDHHIWHIWHIWHTERVWHTKHIRHTKHIEYLQCGAESPSLLLLYRPLPDRRTIREAKLHFTALDWLT
ncbi:hypothetical protein AOQ84DRAFT_228378 [Glonium stellatum]|uniref:Uncharacterized protein n=1 Tax=Glonium stellatum TaxID=574774 RepID=A0A8E2EQD0_9PEZI|nr:hypothetical protein AOQ84DRAFT_228378 [Glonium stellatum]